MKFNQVNKVFLLIVIFLAVGLLSIFVTHNSSPDMDQPTIVIDDNYSATARVWLLSAVQDHSLGNISQLREQLLNFRSSSQTIGQAHINLFLAFDAWQKYLSTNDSYYQIQASNHLILVSKIMPDLSVDIDNLKTILSNA